MSYKSDLENIFEAEDKAAEKRYQAAIKVLAEKLFIQYAPNSFSNVRIEECFDAAKRFIDYKVK